MSFRQKPQEEAEEEAEQQPESATPPEPAPPLHHALTLAPEHAIYQLWELKKKQSEWLPRPELCLEGPADVYGVLSEGEAQRELARLQMTVNSTANARIKQAQPAKDEDGQDVWPDLDAQVVVFLAQDNMTAWLLIYPPVGQGQELDRQMLEDALEEKQVVFGVNQRLLDELPQDDSRYFCLFPAAKGEPPLNGADGRVVDLFQRTVEHKFQVDENNRVDYMSLNFVQNVEEGAVICRIIPPTQGVPGQTVQGKEVPAKDGRPAAAPKGRNTELSEDGSKLLATKTGHVEFSGRSFQVKPLLDIPGNVDYSTGNINFLGDVYIHGDICTGFTVRAMGNITVDGIVEGCTVEAGGDLVLARGAQGDNQAVIRSQKNLFAKFLENCCICVKETLHTDSIINCDVYCDEEVEVRSGRMTIIGGSVRAGHQVSAGVVGSRTEGRTDIFLGGKPCGDFDYGVLEQEISQLEGDLEKAEKEPDSPSKLNRMSKMRMQLMVDRKKLEQLDKEKEQLAEKNQNPGVRRMLCDTVYGGTVLTIDKVSYKFDRTVHPCNATLVEGEIHLI